MKYNPALHHRHSIRLKGYDYSQTGAYFITACTQKRECLFGEIEEGKMRLNEAGLMVLHWYDELENKFAGVQRDEFVCMPNHIHFIINLVGADVGADLCVRPGCEFGQTHGSAPTGDGQTHRSAPTGDGRTHRSAPTNIPTIVQWFKTMTTNEYIRGVKQNGWRPFPGKLWQRNYWERVLRNETELNTTREYINNNPARWELDKLFAPSSESTVGQRGPIKIGEC